MRVGNSGDTTVPDITNRSYRSIFLSDDWAHQRYLGWRIVVDLPGLRIISRRYAVVDRYLILLTRDGLPALDDQIKCLAGFGSLADITVHDFDNVFAGRCELADISFRTTRLNERFLNIATFVIDLRQPEDGILSAMTSDYRRKIKKAEAAGVTVVVEDQPSSDTIAAFLSAYRSLARERGLKPADPIAIASMYAERRALLMVASKNGAASNYLHLYRAADAAIFMYGVNVAKANDGAGQYLHWQAIRHLKAEGVGWYDLGGVLDDAPEDGIFIFKRNFGGQYVSLGSEWRYSGWAVERALEMMGAARQIRSWLF